MLQLVYFLLLDDEDDGDDDADDQKDDDEKKEERRQGGVQKGRYWLDYLWRDETKLAQMEYVAEGLDAFEGAAT